MIHKNVASLMFLTLCSSFFLAGCEGMNSNFSCPMKPGVMCQSLDQVNHQIDEGKMSGSRSSEPVAALINDSAGIEKIERSQEPVMRVWIAPYEDRAGNYYAASFMYRVVAPGSWLTPPLETSAPKTSATGEV